MTRVLAALLLGLAGCAGSHVCAPDAPELCNGLDDDCDGVVDEGEPAALCGHDDAACVTGECVIGPCPVSMADCNDDPSDGCETRLHTPGACTGCGDACWPGAFCDGSRCHSLELDALVASDHMLCVLKNEPRVLCLGVNGALRDAPAEPVHTSVWMPLHRLPDDERIPTIVAGRGHFCAMTESGAVWCWGDRAAVLGEPAGGSCIAGDAVEPVHVADSPGVRYFYVLSAWERATCVNPMAATSLSCWGCYAPPGEAPVPLPPTVPFLGLAAGVVDLTPAALRYAGSVQSYGWPVYDGTSLRPALEPDFVAGQSDQLVGPGWPDGSRSGCSVGRDGAIECWQDDGSDPFRVRPEPLALDRLVARVALGAGASSWCYLGRDRRVLCGGRMPGLGHDRDIAMPGVVIEGSFTVPNVDEHGEQPLAVGDGFGCAVRLDGGLTCWGDLPWVPGEEATGPVPVDLSHD